MDPCEGNCVFGDAYHVDDPRLYDGSKCGCLRCPNFEYCAIWIPPKYLDSHDGRCPDCNASFRKNLVFRDSGEECPICLEGNLFNGRMVDHPSGCGHATCIDCFKFQWDPPSPPDIPPENYGFKASCGSLWWFCRVRGTTEEGCPCENDMDKWKFTYPALEQKWRRDDNAQDDEIDKAISERADPSICAVCRKDVDSAPNNSWDSYTCVRCGIDTTRRLHQSECIH